MEYVYIHAHLYIQKDYIVTLRLKIIEEETCCVCLYSGYDDSMHSAALCYDCKEGWVCRLCYDKMCDDKISIPCPLCRSYNFRPLNVPSDSGMIREANILRLVFAASNGHLEVVLALIGASDHAAEANAMDSEALRLAASKGQLEVVRLPKPNREMCMPAKTATCIKKTVPATGAAIPAAAGRR